MEVNVQYYLYYLILNVIGSFHRFNFVNIRSQKWSRKAKFREIVRVSVCYLLVSLLPVRAPLQKLSISISPHAENAMTLPFLSYRRQLKRKTVSTSVPTTTIIGQKISNSEDWKCNICWRD